ncbi:hypothetical protein BT96DRAFT_918584 [Gymnopus androsaceus JB14]|uniref:Uncharacterized protein n=1 Tax=Gymnopus androsaceus JB14 TaxID=1447944 RepID=A0A6A4HRS9_9AGAR|nr:hypothetical protein BT96DRAFT_918584 [Gymnopus androsaceus JB14]
MATSATTTIDDAQSPAFTFVSAWNAITPSDPCALCALKLNSGDVNDGTWHDCSVNGSTASLTFNGTGVVLYGVTNAAQTSALTFILDGGSSVDLNLSAIPQSPTNVYHYPFFNASGLSSGTHTLSWTIESSIVNAVAVIDYAVVSFDDSSSNSPTAQSSLSSKTIVGAVVGSIIGGLLIAATIFLLLRRRRSQSKNFIPGIEAFRSVLYPREKGARILETSSVPSPQTLLPPPTQNPEESTSSQNPALESSNTTNTTNTQMEQRILSLERILRQADTTELLLDDTSPPPY